MASTPPVPAQPRGVVRCAHPGPHRCPGSASSRVGLRGPCSLLSLSPGRPASWPWQLAAGTRAASTHASRLQVRVARAAQVAWSDCSHVRAQHALPPPPFLFPSLPRPLTTVVLVAVVRTVVVFVASPHGGDAAPVPAAELVLLARLGCLCMGIWGGNRKVVVSGAGHPTTVEETGYRRLGVSGVSGVREIH